MPSCVVPTCKNAVGLTKKHDGITFHVFPTDEKRKSEWTKIIQRARLEEFWKPSNRHVICSLHFEEEFFYNTKGGYRRLKKEAYPNKNLALAPEKSKLCVEKPKSRNDPEPQSPRTNSDIGDVNICELDSVLTDTRRKVMLKSQLLQKQMICQRHVRRIKTLQQRNRRLVKKNESLRAILRILKNNRCVNDKARNLQIHSS